MLPLVFREVGAGVLQVRAEVAAFLHQTALRIEATVTPRAPLPRDGAAAQHDPEWTLALVMEDERARRAERTLELRSRVAADAGSVVLSFAQRADVNAMPPWVTLFLEPTDERYGIAISNVDVDALR